MAFTSTDLTNVQASVVALATGARKTSVTINGKRIDYSPVELDKLIALRNQIQAEVDSEDEIPKFVLTSTVSKGL